MKLSAIGSPKGLGPSGQLLHRDVARLVSALEVQRGKVPAVIPGGAVELRAYCLAVVAYLAANVGTAV